MRRKGFPSLEIERERNTGKAGGGDGLLSYGGNKGGEMVGGGGGRGQDCLIPSHRSRIV